MRPSSADPTYNIKPNNFSMLKALNLTKISTDKYSQLNNMATDQGFRNAPGASRWKGSLSNLLKQPVCMECGKTEQSIHTNKENE